MWYARIKYSRQPIPMEYEFATEAEAQKLCDLKAQHNPYFRWSEVSQIREYPNRPLGNSELPKDYFDMKLETVTV
mgnify:CR=1 FL=1